MLQIVQALLSLKVNSRAALRIYVTSPSQGPMLGMMQGCPDFPQKPRLRRAGSAIEL